MPYMIRKGKGGRPWKIVNRETRKIVGTSKTKAKALASIGHRMSAETGKKRHSTSRS